MNRFVFLLGFLLMALMTVTLQAQKIIPLWQNNMPNSKGIVLKDSVVRERVVQVGIPAVHVYEPSKAERTGTAVLIIPGGGYVKLAHEISGIALAKWYNNVAEAGFHSFNVIAATFYEHYEDILNFYINRSTNAAAESFNAKIKLFRANLRGVVDKSFFLFRLAKIYAYPH